MPGAKCEWQQKPGPINAMATASSCCSSNSNKPELLLSSFGRNQAVRDVQGMRQQRPGPLAMPALLPLATAVDGNNTNAASSL